jgi:ABC-type sulfate transport system permease subunit
MNTEKPEIVSKAIFIFWASIGIGVVRSFIEYPRLVEMSEGIGGVGFVITTQVLGLLFMSGLIWAISKRKNWARWTYLFLFVIGMPFAIMPMIDSLSYSLFSGLLGITQIVGQLVVGIFLFQAPARLWFKKTQEV